MRRFRFGLLTLFVTSLSLPLGAQAVVRSTFSTYSSPVTNEYAAAVGRPLTSGVLDFYDTDLFISGARNVLGAWGTADAGAVNRASNLGTSTAMFATQLGEEIDIFGTGSDIVLNKFRTFSMLSMDVGHLYSTAYAPVTLASFNLTVFGFGPSTDNYVISQVFTIFAPTAVGGVQTPFLQTLTFDNRWRAVDNVWWNQSTGSATANQFTNVNAAIVPEPATYALTCVGLLCIGVVRTRRRRNVG